MFLYVLVLSGTVINVQANESITEDQNAVINTEGDKDNYLKNMVDEYLGKDRSNVSNDEVLEALFQVNPKLSLYSGEDFNYDSETGHIECNISKDDMFSKEGNERATAWSLLARGDILINHSTSSSFELLKYGHAALMDSKGLRPNESTTYETRGKDKPARSYDYSAWHNNNHDKMSYNYVKSKYNQPNFTQITNAALNKARTYQGTPYHIGLNNAIYVP